MSKLEWQAPEYIHRHKSADWYWIVGIVAISLALIAIILNNVIFGILIIVSAFTLSLYATREPRMLHIELTRLGVRIGSTYCPYSDLESFWVEMHTPFPKIIFKSKKRTMFYITALIEEVNPEEVENFLENHLPKVEHSEPLLEKLLIYLGF